MPTRREFGKLIIGAVPTVALGGGLVMTTAGLSCSNIFTDIETYVPVGLEAFEEVLSLISPAEGAALAGIITIVKAAFADLAAAVTAYENAPAANKSTLLGKITTAINAVMGELQQFWTDANLPDGTLASTIENVLQVILSTLAAFLPLIGGAMSAKYQALLAKLPKQIPFTPQKRTQKQFKAAVNAAFSSHGYSNVIY
jgi:hypothetical protein